MPLIAPRNPGQSWLLYKTLLAPLPTVDVTTRRYTCDGSYGTPLASFTLPAGATQAPSDRELAVLRDHVLGVEMPFPPPGQVPPSDENRPLSFQEREVLRLWIAKGASVVECGACYPADPVADAGQDAQPADAGTD